MSGLLHSLAVAAPATSDIHTIIDGLIVVSLFAILGVGIKMLRGQRHTHEALWGFSEGNRDEPGIVEIVRGNGHGSLLVVGEAAMTEAHDARVQSEANGDALAEHVVEDNKRWDEIQAGLAILHVGQRSAAQTADAVSVELHAPLPAPRSPVKKAAPRKRAAPKKAAAQKEVP